MNRRSGFTLIEVLLALFLVSAVGLILVLNINNLTSNRVEKEYERALDRLISASDVYINSEPGLKDKIYINKDTVTFTIDRLYNQGLLDEESLINPKTDKKFVGHMQAKAVNQVLEIKYVE